MGPVRLKDVEEAQGYLVGLAKDLAASGEIVIADGRAKTSWSTDAWHAAQIPVRAVLRRRRAAALGVAPAAARAAGHAAPRSRRRAPPAFAEGRKAGLAEAAQSRRRRAPPTRSPRSPPTSRRCWRNARQCDADAETPGDPGDARHHAQGGSGALPQGPACRSRGAWSTPACTRRRGAAHRAARRRDPVRAGAATPRRPRRRRRLCRQARAARRWRRSAPATCASNGPMAAPSATRAAPDAPRSTWRS